MWIYEQATGKFFSAAGVLVATGYSGRGPWKNCGNAEGLRGKGPIPRGQWSIGEPMDSQKDGPICFRLTPADGTKTYGRDGFLIHGDSIRAPGEGSHGCVILPRPARLRISQSTDRDLLVR